jgi:hypothetical protein
MKSKLANTNIKPHYFIQDGYVVRKWRDQVKFLYKAG